jgi:hypothetical protein
MPRRIVIGVGIASYPLHAAGNTWAFLEWVLGFRAAGWDVWIVEDIHSAKCVDATGKEGCPPADSVNLAYWNDIVGQFGLKDRATLIIDGQSPALPELLRFARDAELFFNISGHFRQEAVLAAPAQRVYVDIDPAFTQIWSEIYHADMKMDGHDIFVSIGRHLGKPGCHAPLAGRNWLPIGVPVMLDYFQPQGMVPGQTWTTFTHWYGYPQVEYDGAWFGNKSEEFAKLVDLPGKTAEKLEIATDLHPEDKAVQQFLAGGWSLIDARPLNTPWQRYRDYAAQSRGEFCVAKNGYVRSRCGWFSDRSAMYLALGRPVILQDTGWTDFYPSGEGLLAFHDEASALEALETVARDPVRHARAARAIAEKYCSAPLVVSQFLETIGLAK